MTRRTTVLLLAALALGCARRAAPVPPHAIVAVGDSLTQGYHMKPEESWPSHLARLLGRPVVNRGVSGETAAQTLERLRREGLPDKTSAVLLCLGANDILRGLPPDDTVDALRHAVRYAQERGAQVAVIGLESYRSPRHAFDYGAAYRRVAADAGALYVPDLTRETMGRPHLMRDAIHPSAAGNELIARRLSEVLRPWLAR